MPYVDRELFVRSIADAMPGMVAYWDKNLCCRFANKAYLEWFGKTPDSVVGHSIQELMGEHLFALNEPYIRSALAGELQRFERTLTKADGSIGYTLANYVPDIDANGTVSGFFVLVSDVTPLKLVEIELKSANAELARLYEEASIANCELDSFAYAISHDLRSPLRAIRGFTAALLECDGDRLSDEGRTYLEQIKLGSLRMSEQIDGLLELAKTTRGELKLDTIDLTGLCYGVLTELAKADPQRKVVVEVEAGLEAWGDKRMILGVMENLLGNAWKYTARVELPRIRVYSEVRNHIRSYCVSDNGAGFDMTHANQLFQPFKRLHRQDEFPGLGIGLATVRRIIQRHGGNIEAHGKPGEGAVFSFTLPDRPR